MTLLEIAYRCGRPPGEAELQALREVREVYGIWRVSLSENGGVMRVEYDASRLAEDDVAALLRDAGVDVREKIAPGSRLAA